jgi:hypothetical protein
LSSSVETTRSEVAPGQTATQIADAFVDDMKVRDHVTIRADHKSGTGLFNHLRRRWLFRRRRSGFFGRGGGGGRSGSFLGRIYKIHVRGGEAACFDAVDAKRDDGHQFIDVMQDEGDGL